MFSGKAQRTNLELWSSLISVSNNSVILVPDCRTCSIANCWIEKMIILKFVVFCMKKKISEIQNWWNYFSKKIFGRFIIQVFFFLKLNAQEILTRNGAQVSGKYSMRSARSSQCHWKLRQITKSLTPDRSKALQIFRGST